MEEKDYWLAFSAFPGVGPKKFKLLLDHFGSARKAWEAPETELLNLPLGKKLITSFFGFRKSFTPEVNTKRLKEKRLFAICLEEENYPKLLKEIENPPPVIYAYSMKYGAYNIGELFEKPAIAVVGTRKVTAYGRQVTEMLVADLVAAGLVITSGLMYGIDEVGELAAMENGGETIGVWAGGLDTLFLTGRGQLAKEVIKKGAIISEFPLGLSPSKGTFPARNRIVSGLSLGVLMIEGTSDSGALITADYAVKQNRKVFAVPGPITVAQSAGTTKLLKSGAKLVANVNDILEELKIANGRQILAAGKILPDDKNEAVILELLENEGKHVDEIIKKSGMGAGKIAGILTLMEIKGKIRNLGGKYELNYRRITN
ncbi:DNA-protecting protein DprA [Candidatus Shapirobacteria bacterium]|nr:DNA-protecting protein DprA [Candidatus Shapirobacteria bacterium]